MERSQVGSAVILDLSMEARAHDRKNVLVWGSVASSAGKEEGLKLLTLKFENNRRLNEGTEAFESAIDTTEDINEAVADVTVDLCVAPIGVCASASLVDSLVNFFVLPHNVLLDTLYDSYCRQLEEVQRRTLAAFTRRSRIHLSLTCGGVSLLLCAVGHDDQDVSITASCERIVLSTQTPMPRLEDVIEGRTWHVRMKMFLRRARRWRISGFRRACGEDRILRLVDWRWHAHGNRLVGFCSA